MEKIYTIFYSWQSDLKDEIKPHVIRGALKKASSLVETELEGIRIDIDSATREMAGSPPIPATIYNKISVSDIFICDLTIINAYAPAEKRKVSNPNVLIELGYAAAILGWNRIIILVNKNFGVFPADMPFDITSHRVADFILSDNANKNEKNQLTNLLKCAIQTIIEQSPLKPADIRSETPEEQKRKRDISNIKCLLNTIHINTFDYFIQEFPDMIIRKILYFKDSFDSVFVSSSFYIYDTELLEYISTFNQLWSKSLSYYQHYSGSNGLSDNYKFYTPGDTFQSPEAERDYNELQKIRIDLANCFKELLTYIRNNYLEIDIEEASKNAFESYKRDLAE